MFQQNINSRLNRRNDKQNAIVASTTALPSFTSLDTITIEADANGLLPDQDGKTLNIDDVFFNKDEAGSDKAWNGLLQIVSLGSAGSKFKLRRPRNFRNDKSIKQGATFYIEEGATNATKTYLLVTTGIVPGTTELDFIVIEGSTGGQFIGRNIEMRNVATPAASENEQDGWPVFILNNGQIKMIASSIHVPSNFDPSFDPFIVAQYCPTSLGGANGNLELFIELTYVDVNQNTNKAVDETPFGLFTGIPEQVVDTVGLIHEITWTLDGSLLIPCGRIKATVIRSDGIFDTYGGDIGIFTNLFVVFKTL